MTTYLDTRKRTRPFLQMSNQTINYIEHAEPLEFDNVVTFWTTLTKVSDVVQNGKRLENISWRLVNRKLLLRNELTKNDFSTIVDVSKGEECKELKDRQGSHRRKVQKKVNIVPPSPVPSLFSSRSSSTNISTTKHIDPTVEQQHTKRKPHFYFDHESPSSPDSASMSPPNFNTQNQHIHKSIRYVIENHERKGQSPPNTQSNNPMKNSIKSKNIPSQHVQSNQNQHPHTRQHPHVNPTPQANLYSHANPHHHTNVHPHPYPQNPNPHNFLSSLFTKHDQVHNLYHNQQQHTSIHTIKNDKQIPPSLFSKPQPQIRLKSTTTLSQLKSTASQTSIASQNSHTSLFQNKSNAGKVVVYSSSEEDIYDDDDDDDDNEDDESEWSSLSGDEDEEDTDTLEFRKQSVNVQTDDETPRPVLKRSLLSGLFINELDKDKEKEKDKDNSKGKADENGPSKRESKISDNDHDYDSHHKSNAPLTAVTLLPTALSTHMILPTKNFQTFQSVQRHQYKGERTHAHGLTMTGIVNNNKTPPVNNATTTKYQLTKDNIAKLIATNNVNNSNNKNNTNNDSISEYASSIKTSTSSIDIPIVNNKSRARRKVINNLDVGLIDSLQQENKPLVMVAHKNHIVNGCGDSSSSNKVFTSDGYIDDQMIISKYGKVNRDDNDDLNYHSKGW